MTTPSGGDPIEIGIYVQGDELNKTVTDCPIAAWMISPTPDQKKMPAVLNVVTEKVEFVLPETFNIGSTMEVLVSCLHAKECVVADERSNVELLREPSDLLDVKKKRGRGTQVAQAQGILELLAPDVVCTKRRKALQAELQTGPKGQAKAKAGAKAKSKADFLHLLR